jgi:hypothetical protein
VSFSICAPGSELNWFILDHSSTYSSGSLESR